jgi:antibiotic biosynthesis monooxygenase (ABM) superfamily enzyme
VKTVKVKIAVHIDFDGNWNAAGWGNGPDQTSYVHSEEAMMEIAAEEGTEGEQYWVVAELEIPEAPKVKEIEASVEEV